jgi:carboxypeptidase Q
MNGSLPTGEFSTMTAYFSSYPLRTAGSNEASKQGAVGYILRSLTLADDNVPHTGNTSYEEGITKIPAVAIGIRDADCLSELLKQDSQVRIKLQLLGNNRPRR